MALIANGVGSGLDISGLVSQLMSLEARPLNQLNSREASFQAQLSAFGQFKSALTPIQSALTGLKEASRFQAMRASLGDASLATATATSEALKGTYSFEVAQIAQGQRVITNDATAPSVGEGTLTFSFGTYSTDSSDPDNPVISFTATKVETLTLGPGKETLSDLRDAINEADIGLRAQIVDNGTTQQLVLAGTGEGINAAFKIEGSGDLTGFSFDLTTGSTSTLTSIETAQDAKIRIDGITLTRPTNTISDAIEGVTLNLLKGDPGKTTTLTVANDRTAVKTSIEALVKAYNEFNKTSRSLTAVDAEAKTRGILTGDSTARGIQTQMRNAFGAIFSGSDGVSSLSEIGISFNRDGSLSINSATLDAALNDPDKKVADFFAGSENAKGFAATLQDRLDGYLRSGGLLEARTGGLNGSIKSLDRQRESLALRLDMIEKRYRAQFTALDAMIGSMTQTSNYLQQQLANLPKLNNGQ